MQNLYNTQQFCNLDQPRNGEKEINEDEVCMFFDLEGSTQVVIYQTNDATINHIVKREMKSS